MANASIEDLAVDIYCTKDTARSFIHAAQKVLRNAEIKEQSRVIPKLAGNITKIKNLTGIGKKYTIECQILELPNTTKMDSREYIETIVGDETGEINLLVLPKSVNKFQNLKVGEKLRLGNTLLNENKRGEKLIQIMLYTSVTRL